MDKNVHTRYMRSDRQTTSLHYFHAFAALDRFDLSNYTEDLPPIPDSPPLQELLPLQSDIIKLEENFSIHIGRVLCKYMPYFQEDYGDVVPTHIAHPLTEEMSKKSKVVRMIVVGVASYI